MFEKFIKHFRVCSKISEQSYRLQDNSTESHSFPHYTEFLFAKDGLPAVRTNSQKSPHFIDRHNPKLALGP